jgi:hypothetical protein
MDSQDRCPGSQYGHGPHGVTSWEPPIGIEPMTYALRVACCLPAHALPAPIARIIAPTAPTTLELSGTPFHEPFHGAAPQIQKGDLNRSDHRSSGL